MTTMDRSEDVSVRFRHKTDWQEKPIMARHVGDHFEVTYDPELASLGAATMLTRFGLRQRGFVVTEVLLDGHDPDLAALHRAASKLLLDVEYSSGPLITEPVVKQRDKEEWSYFVPDHWDLADALDRLPSAFAEARPDIARNLELIEQAKRNTGGELDEIFDITARSVLQSGDPQGVYDEVLSLFEQARQSKDAAVAPTSNGT